MQSCDTEFARLFEDETYSDLLGLSDAKLRTDDGCTFDVHRVMLARSSDYFRSMFCGMDKKRRKFRIPGISGGCLSQILLLIYTGNIRITERNVRDLIIGADYLLLKDFDLIEEITHNIEANISVVNCLPILQASHQICNRDIFQKCFRFVQTRFEKIMHCQKEDLADLPPEILRLILRDRSLYVYNETTVWQAIVVWTQKDIPLRMSYVPKLLLTLAIEDVGEELATEILQHEIISKNCLMKDLVGIPSSNDLPTNPDVLLTFLRGFSNCFMEQNQNHSHRIPLQLFFILSESNNLYVTYDENTDLCRKITHVSCDPDVLITIGHNIYIFEMSEYIFDIFNLSTMNEVRTEIFRKDYFEEFFIVATDAYIYVLGGTDDEEDSEGTDEEEDSEESDDEEDSEETDDEEDLSEGTYAVEVYDIANNSWCDGVPLRDISLGAAVAIGKMVYVVGKTAMSDDRMTQVFDPDTQKWSILSILPAVCSSEFALVTYHQKMYLIRNSEAEMFDPSTNLWKKLPDLPFTYSSPKVMVINDQIVVCNDDDYAHVVRWNNVKECWERLHETDTLNDLDSLKFWIVDDVETIRMITKQNRDPKTKMEKSNFN